MSEIGDRSQLKEDGRVTRGDLEVSQGKEKKKARKRSHMRDSRQAQLWPRSLYMCIYISCLCLSNCLSVMLSASYLELKSVWILGSYGIRPREAAASSACWDCRRRVSSLGMRASKTPASQEKLTLLVSRKRSRMSSVEK